MVHEGLAVASPSTLVVRMYVVARLLFERPPKGASPTASRERAPTRDATVRVALFQREIEPLVGAGSQVLAAHEHSRAGVPPQQSAVVVWWPHRLGSLVVRHRLTERLVR